MAQLELVRLHDDGINLLLRDADGGEHQLPICAELCAAVASIQVNQEKIIMLDAPISVPTAPPLPTEPAAPLRPAEIQSRLRAGESVEEIAATSGTPIERVRRFESPILAERAHVIQTLRRHRIENLDETSALGELADARLQARGVAPGDAEWSARRVSGTPWQIEVRFAAGEDDLVAGWNYDLRTHLLTPLDDIARWLSQPDDPIVPEILRVPKFPRRRAALPEPVAESATETILDDLANRRGLRQSEPVAAPAAERPIVAVGITQEVEPKPETARAPIVELPSRAARSSSASSAAAKPGGVGGVGKAAATGKTPPRKRTKPARSTMPSVDDILLGIKRED